jgi:L-2-hydroxyglutarate oxidase LhgO
MAAYHDENGLPLNRCGKLLVPTTPEFAAQMDTIAQRARENGVRVEKIDAQTLAEMEPETRSATGEALWVPDTAVGNPVKVIRTLVREVADKGVEVRFGAALAQVEPGRVILENKDAIAFGFAVNAAGLHADRIAHQFNAARRYALLPFKGLYWKLSPTAGIRLNHLIYPVPDLRILYLGVHTTTATDGAIYLGPTAVPAFGREQYRGLASVRLPESLRMLRDVGRMFLRDKEGFRQQAWQEGRRYFKPWFFKAAADLLPRLRPEHLMPATKTGLHPRMFDRETGSLLKDFHLEKSQNALHILGVTSPAWTSAFPLARHICDTIEADA